VSKCKFGEMCLPISGGRRKCMTILEVCLTVSKGFLASAMENDKEGVFGQQQWRMKKTIGDAQRPTTPPSWATEYGETECLRSSGTQMPAILTQEPYHCCGMLVGTCADCITYTTQSPLLGIVATVIFATVSILCSTRLAQSSQDSLIDPTEIKQETASQGRSRPCPQSSSH
jgi:hypothetical protein